MHRHGELEPTNHPDRIPNIVSRPQPVFQFSNFVASSELEALEQRLETLDSAKLQQSMAVNTPEDILPLQTLPLRESPLDGSKAVALLNKFL